MAAGGEPLRVLIGDDHPGSRTGARLALEDQGFLVCAEEASGPAAVEAAIHERPDVCLLDIQMPGGGIAAAREIAARVPESAIVMLTASRDEEHVFQALRAGARGYLLKDIDPERLPVAVRAVVRGEVALPRSLVGILVDEFRRQEGAPGGLVRRGPEDLTEREWDVLDCMSEGLTTSQIAERLFLADVTVRRHVGGILRKLNVTSREEAVRLAARSTDLGRS